MNQAFELRWFRFSRRQVLVIAALVAAITVVATIWLWRRADYLLQRSEEHLMQAAMFWQVVDAMDRLPMRNAKQEAIRKQFQAQFDYHASLSLEYEAAIWRPWLTVEQVEPPP